MIRKLLAMMMVVILALTMMSTYGFAEEAPKPSPYIDAVKNLNVEGMKTMEIDAYYEGINAQLYFATDDVNMQISGFAVDSAETLGEGMDTIEGWMYLVNQELYLGYRAGEDERFVHIINEPEEFIGADGESVDAEPISYDDVVEMAQEQAVDAKTEIEYDLLEEVGYQDDGESSCVVVHAVLDTSKLQEQVSEQLMIDTKIPEENTMLDMLFYVDIVSEKIVKIEITEELAEPVTIILGYEPEEIVLPNEFTEDKAEEMTLDNLIEKALGFVFGSLVD